MLADAKIAKSQLIINQTRLGVVGGAFSRNDTQISSC